VAPQYQIIVDSDILDRLYVKVEVNPQKWDSPDFDKDAFTEEVMQSLKAVLTLTARVGLLAPGSIERSEGKAVRVIDLRGQKGVAS